MVNQSFLISNINAVKDNFFINAKTRSEGPTAENHACFHLKDLNRLWGGPIPENGGWHLAREVKMAANKRLQKRRSEASSIAEVVDTIDYQQDLKQVGTPAYLTGTET
ncbi:hypothetical protein Tco_0228554 [Tanacetum coccineum]